MQRNALKKAFEQGLINDMLNKRFMDDMFSGDQIKVLPVIEHNSIDDDIKVKYLSEN